MEEKADIGSLWCAVRIPSSDHYGPMFSHVPTCSLYSPTGTVFASNDCCASLVHTNLLSFFIKACRNVTDRWKKLHFLASTSARRSMSKTISSLRRFSGVGAKITTSSKAHTLPRVPVGISSVAALLPSEAGACGTEVPRWILMQLLSDKVVVLDPVPPHSCDGGYRAKGTSKEVDNKPVKERSRWHTKNSTGDNHNDSSSVASYDRGRPRYFKQLSFRRGYGVCDDGGTSDDNGTSSSPRNSTRRCRHRSPSSPSRTAMATAAIYRHPPSD